MSEKDRTLGLPPYEFYVKWSDEMSDHKDAPLGFDPASGYWRLETHMSELFTRTMRLLAKTLRTGAYEPVGPEGYPHFTCEDAIADHLDLLADAVEVRHE